MKQILLFDRALLVRMRIKEALSSSDIKIHEVDSEYEIFNAIQRLHSTLDLIIMDVVLDGTDGFDLVRRIKEAQNDIPLVILTSSNKRADFIKGVQAGASDYILKPFDDEFFKMRIFSVMSNHKEFKKQESLMSEQKNRQRTEEPKATGTLPVAPMSSGGIDKGIPKPFDAKQGESSFKELLKAEKYKAKKGKYPLSIFALVFEMGEEQKGKFCEKHFIDIRAQLWESDECVHYGPCSFYGILPFCHEAGLDRFKEKMHIFLNEEAIEKEFYHQYKWHVIGMTLSSAEYEDLEIPQIMELLRMEVESELKR